MKALTCLPCVGHSQQVRVHDVCLDNLRRGVVERVFCVRNTEGELVAPTRPRKGTFQKCLAHVRARLLRVCPKISRLSYEEFLRECPAHKRKTYTAAVESLRVRRVTKRDARVRAFLKVEKLNWSLKPDPAARIIHPRHPRYNVEVGRYLRVAERYMYNSLRRMLGGRNGLRVVMKGMNAIEVGEEIAAKWRKFRKPIAVGLDASRFDQHVSVEALKWEHGIYLSMFPKGQRRLLARLLRWQLKNNVVAVARDGGLKYTTDGCRMSGDMNTSLGNCLLMVSMVAAYCEERKILNYELVNNGDDCVIILEKEDLGRLVDSLDSWFLDMGFTMKVEKPVDVLEKIEFCQGHPVKIGNKYRMVRNLHPGISREMVTDKPVRNPQELKFWLRSVGQGGLALTGGVPIYQNMYRRMALLAGPGKVTSHSSYSKSNTMKYWADRMNCDYSPVNADTRVSFYQAFGILPDSQVAIEQEFDVWEINTQEASVEIVSVFPTFTQDWYKQGAKQAQQR